MNYSTSHQMPHLERTDSGWSVVSAEGHEVATATTRTEAVQALTAARAAKLAELQAETFTLDELMGK